MSKQKVFLVGATGETGNVILEALIEDDSFDITCLIRPASSNKPSVQTLRDRGLKIVTGSSSGPVPELAQLLQGIDTVISTIFPLAITEQLPLIDAAVLAGVKRFLPCNWGTTAPRGDIMQLRDLKEDVHDHIFRSRLGFTIIDVGFWYQMSFPRVPSGKFDYACFLPINEVYADGNTPNMLMDQKDVGRLTARVIKDPRTLNKRVYSYGEVLSQNQIHEIIEAKTGETLELIPRSAEEVYATLEAAKEAAKTNPISAFGVVGAQYAVTKYLRGDNTPEMAEYLGYMDGRELYPDLEYRKFADFVDELVAGKAARVYPHLHF